jgi:hypothetical protein
VPKTKKWWYDFVNFWERILIIKQIARSSDIEEVVFRHNTIIFIVNRTMADNQSVYEAARFAWRISRAKVENAELVLAVEHGKVIGVFVPERWLPATKENFPDHRPKLEGRWGFEGREAPREIATQYVDRRLPDAMRRPGAANPVRFASASP